MSNKTLVGIVVVVLILGGAFLLIKNKGSYTPSYPSQNKSVQTTPVPTKPQLTTTPTPASGKQESQNTIVYSSSGFSPSSLTIKVGEKVVWTNEDGGLSVNSSLHPTHTDYPPLNLGSIANGQSKSLVFDKAGTYRYHNHLNSSHYGTIIVK